MQIRRCEENGVVYITYQNIEKTGIVTHGFSTRVGGISEDYLGSMNLSYTRGDKKENVDENFIRMGTAIGFDPKNLVFTDQTHTTNVLIADRKSQAHDFDGLITNEKDLVLTASFADCVPLFFVDPVKKVIGLSHSGWKGTVQKMGAVTIQKMKEVYGCSPLDIHVAIGPSICVQCYEVSKDVAEAFKEKFTKEQIEQILFPGNKEGKYQLDLWKANELICLEAGIIREHLELPEICTCCNKEFLYSHRGSNGNRGNLGAFLSL